MPKERSLSDLKTMLRNELANIQKDVGRLTIETAQTLLSQVVTKTPVDTSTALSNWQVQLGTLSGSIIPAYMLGEKGSTYGQSVSFAVQVGSANIDRHKFSEPIFIFNCVDYIIDLEQGSSPQRPQGGFVKESVMFAVLSLQGKVKSWQKKRL